MFEALREVREEKGISQGALALDTGFDRTYLSLIERGVKSPTIRAFVKMATVLGARPGRLWGGRNECCPWRSRIGT